MHAPQQPCTPPMATMHTPQNHAHPPGTTQAPRNHACPPCNHACTPATTHTHPATMHAPQQPCTPSNHTHPSNHACPPRATTCAPRQPHTPLWTEWQTGVKILPCPKLRLRAVIMSLVMSLINRSADWPLRNYHKTVRTFLQIFCISSFNEWSLNEPAISVQSMSWGPVFSHRC